MTEIDSIIRTSLVSFIESVFDSGWFGKEREAVSLYAFGHLLPQCKPDSILSDPRQIGIEVRVPSPPGAAYKKAETTKDLIVWPEPAWTCWDEHGESTRAPIALVEWKVGKRNVSTYDVRWLKDFTSVHPTCLGYALTVDLQARNFHLSCTRIEAGEAKAEWLTC